MNYKNKKILIIGGTGTIGRKIMEEILIQEPAVIRVLSRDEHKQFMIENEIGNKSNIRLLIGDVRDYDRVERACRDIDIVFNLAAMKHVPACEYNPTEAMKTNIIGMDNVIKAARNHNIETVIFTSSDKAINPTNVYGATKLLAERITQAANFSRGNARTKFVVVRFGNVLGSRGSIIPLFEKQILEQRKVTVTDQNMSRFMMTLTQAAALTMQVPENCLGGEIFILKMPVIRLKDLVEIVIEETCEKYDIDVYEVKIETIGIRPGEKFYEELMTEEESKFAFDLGKMYAVCPVTYGIEKFMEFYKNYNPVDIGSYRSHNMEPISKEEVRKLVRGAGR
ncbi:FlaA1/EpsC-like NDP-sugar epimerase [Anaerosolibacter carboniphilus]|uniref:FlaA1/EpsC-like NDP-sugar epimerase n=1 Tax=Anaerosolibacter carboniphilus TaxID=1417629 RepID=A0A841KQH4_9FIRM|nr:SDR family NAD(P)-dependent oxidoreductase [Anaerosolibacter carboniphilus]MBB6215736.1 FlaA1/EpsC-like NDP-sugar epimerase [Anaerosolibacter carboniphilus]